MMSIFQCSKCGCVENTACCDYWWEVYHEKKPALCSECNPKIGRWHGRFEKQPASGYWIGADGFLYDHEDSPRHTKLVKEVK